MTPPFQRTSGGLPAGPLRGACSLHRLGLWAMLAMLPGPATAANLCINPGFETAESTSIIGFPGVPSSYGDWGGDQSQIVAAENGISPRDGAAMLRFDATGNSVDALLNTSQVYQLVDVSLHSTLISSGSAIANLTAWFNRVDFDSQTDTGFSVSIFALSGDPSGFQAQLVNATYLDRQSGGLASDADPASWEPAFATMAIPSATDYLAIQLTASENVVNDGTVPEFDGHYADSVSLEIIPESSTALVSAIGVLMLAGALRRRGS